MYRHVSTPTTDVYIQSRILSLISYGRFGFFSQEVWGEGDVKESGEIKIKERGTVAIKESYKYKRIHKSRLIMSFAIIFLQFLCSYYKHIL